MTSEQPGESAREIDFERFFELAVDVMVVTGPEGRFERVNSALARLLGVSKDVILANPWSEFVHPDDRDASTEENTREFDDVGHRTITFENRYVDIGGGVHWMDWNADLDPETGLVYGTARDVTEQRAARHALEEAHHEAEAARASAEEARAAAEAANMAKSEFLSQMSHELRTPLNAILGFGQLLELDQLEGDQSDSVRQILLSGRHLLGLIDEVLDIARIESGAVSMSVEPVRVGDAVADALSLLGPLATAQGVTLRATSVRDADDYVMADRRRLHQVLVNYLANAIKYTPPGSVATVESTAIRDGWLRIAVVDNGRGIPAELLDRLFKPFDRIGAEQTSVEGTGLGLAHSKALAEHMGGSVGADSTLGRGSTFWVELPLGEAPARRADVSGRRHDAIDANVSGTVLYIEDNSANTLLLERLLTRRPGLRLRSAMLGRLGLDLARELRPDLIALDLHLPDISGETILTILRSDPRTEDIPVVILSADATLRQIDHLLAMGAAAYLTKPIDVMQLLTIIDQYVGGSDRP
ncbi:MAG: Multi-sensor hybrid histidine kinase [Acidimicrobiales bacterium]|jgi:PAS domain S-box-containing protein|nr:Multi-sensor hybrid histidine kinase [Acidimicrobiales bacterium]